MAAKTIIFNSAFTSYKRISQIGSGGAGTVVKVEDEDGATYAIKYLSPKNLTTEKGKRFKNELQFCFKNEHPNVLKVLDWGRCEIDKTSSPFYVMPLYTKSMRDLLKAGISPENIMRYFSQILDGVEAAHLQGVYHRDLKPENILYDASTDRLVIADFGIARFAEDQLHTHVETKPASRLANFQYSAPEQREKGLPVDHRADIYALGLILNEMFTGKLALGVDFKKISSVLPDLSYLDEMVDSMLKQDPEFRPNDIATIKRGLIARKHDFVEQQKLSQLKKKVIPESDLDDPLISNPPEIIDAKWESGKLIIDLSRPVNHKWFGWFKNPGGHSSVMGYGPETFDFYESQIVAPCRGETAQRILDHTKHYVRAANDHYKRSLEQEAQTKKDKEEVQLQKAIEMAEQSKAINKTLKL